MGAHSGPNISAVSDMLYALDSQSIKTASVDGSNLLAEYPWEVGTGSYGAYGQNGDGNSRILDTTPFGTTDVVWDVSNQDATSDADGGWNTYQDSTYTFPIDPNKMYRWSVWVRRKVIGNGPFYLGLNGFNGTNNVGVYNRSNGANNTNPYFVAANWWGNANEWYLVVGHVWPAGSGTGSAHPESGIYNTSGTRVASAGDFVWRTDNNRTRHRSYLYYSTNTSTNQQFWQPRIDTIEAPGCPSLRDLLGGRGTRFNLIGNAPKTSLRKVYRTSSGFQFGAADSDKTIQIPLSETFNKQEGTIACWIYPTGYSGSNGIFVNRDNSTANAADWLWLGVWSSGSILYFRTGNGSTCCSQDLIVSSFSTTHAPINKWTYLAATWKSNSTANIYVNGVLVATRTVGNIPSTNPSATGRIGLGHDSGGTGSWSGKIDAFKIYRTQLTANQIAANYHAFKSRYV